MASSQIYMRRLLLTTSRTQIPRIIPRTRIPLQRRALSLWGSSKSTPTTPPDISSPSHSTTFPNIDSSSRTIHASKDVSAEISLDSSDSFSLDPPSEAVSESFSATSNVADHLSERIGYLREVCGLDFGYGQSTCVQWLLEHLHIWGDMSWTSSIVAMGVILRMSMLPLMVMQADQTARTRSMNAQAVPVQKMLAEAKEKGDIAKQQQYTKEYLDLRKEYGISMTKMFLPIIAQITFGFGAWRVLRNACEVPVPGFVTESWLWTDNLTVGDPYLILPVASGLLTYLTLKANKRASAGVTASTASIQSGLMKAMPILSMGFVALQPGAVQLYFVSATLVGWSNALLLNSDAFRRLCVLPSLGMIQTLTNTGPTHPTAPAYISTPSSFGGMRVSAFEAKHKAEAEAEAANQARLAQEKQESSLPDRAVDGWKKWKASAKKDVSQALGRSEVKEKPAELARKQRNDILTKRELEDLRKERNRDMGIDDK